MLILSQRGISYTDIFCLLIFPSITNCIMYFNMYADEMEQVIEIKFFFFFFIIDIYLANPAYIGIFGYVCLNTKQRSFNLEKASS